MSKNSGVWTQGTQLYVLGPKSDSETDLVITTVKRVTNVSPGSSPRSEIKTTDLEERGAQTYLDGLGEPGEASISIILSTDEPSHHYLLDMYKARKPLKFAVGLSDGWIEASNDGVKPEIEGDELKLPETRSWISFNGSIKDFPPEIAENDVVKFTIPIKVSGMPMPQFKKPVVAED